MNDEKVEWRPVPGASRYEVSSNGLIRGQNKKVRKPTIQDGYCCLNIIDDDGYMRRGRVHRLVALAFIGPAYGRCVNHVDGNRSNNAVGNLEYVSHQQNIRHSRGDADYRRRKTRQDRAYKTKTPQDYILAGSPFGSTRSRCGRRPKPFYCSDSKRWRILVNGKRHTLAKTLERSLEILDKYGIDYNREKLFASLPESNLEPFTFIA